MASPYPVQINLVAFAKLSPAVHNNPRREPDALPTNNYRVLDNYTPRYQPRKSAMKPTRAPNASLLAALKKSKNRPLLSTSAPLPQIFQRQETLVDGRDRFWDVDLEGGQQPAAAVLPARSNDCEYTRVETEKEDAKMQWLAKLREKKLKRMDRGVVLGLAVVLCFVTAFITALAVLSRILGPW
jgi:hypothetical protein